MENIQDLTLVQLDYVRQTLRDRVNALKTEVSNAEFLAKRVDDIYFAKQEQARK